MSLIFAMTLYRRYRPQTFTDLFGQEHVRQTLENAAKRQQISHAYLFTGPRGTGKTSSARILAKVLNCDQIKDGNPCNECENCQQINNGQILDIIEIDAASNRGIDEIRELKQTIQFQPTYVRNKLYIIDEVHMLTKEAFNALLKTLEEPPDYVYFVLATTEIDKIPETIISRCQRFDFRRLTEAVITERLKFIAESEKMHFELPALALIAKASAGGLRDAISLLEQLSSLYEDLTEAQVAAFLGQTEQKLCDDYIDAVADCDLAQALAVVTKFVDGGYQLQQVYKDLLMSLRSRFLEAVKNGGDAIWVINFVETLERNQQLFQQSAIPQLLFEVTAAGLIGVKKQERPADLPDAPKPEPVAREHRPLASTTKPEVAETPVEVAADDNLAPGEEISFRDLKRSWNKVVDRVSASVLRVSLKQAQLKDFQNDTLILAFVSNFHLEQVKQAQAVSSIETALSQQFGRKINVEVEGGAVAEVSASATSLEDAQQSDPLAMFEGM